MLKLNGVFTALITPFDGGEIDFDCLQALARRQVEAGVHGLVPLGSTGEAATLTFDERARVIETVLKEASGKIPVIVGAGTNNTAETIKIVQQAKDLGADAAMSVTPYSINRMRKGFWRTIMLLVRQLIFRFWPITFRGVRG